MNCEVSYTAMSMRFRYKILTINDEDYLIDEDRPIWVLFIPFAYWLIPHTIYKISNQHILRQIKEPTVKQTKASYVIIFGIGMTVFLSNLLRPLMDYFEIEMSTNLNSLILFQAILFIISLRLFISRINKRNLKRIVNINDYKRKNCGFVHRV